jgi:hypothetical protein
MKDKRILLTYLDLTVEVEERPGQELIDHMHSTVLGQPGSFRYQHTNLTERLTAPGENYFMYLRKSGKMLGSVGFVGRHTETSGVAHDSWMIRFFSIRAPMSSVPKRRKSEDELKDGDKRSTVLGRFIQPVMANPSSLREGKENEHAPAIIYALIEQKNLRSMNFSAQMGLETVGEVANFSFSRLRPGRSVRIERLEESEQEPMLSLLHSFYRDYNLFYPDPLFRDEDYYVIRESGRVVAGLQVYPVDWRIVDFGAGMANGMVRILTKIPWVRRRVDPDDLRMLAVDGIYCEQGYEAVLYELMEGVLEGKGVHIAMLMTDKTSHLHSIFRDRGKLGFLHRILGSFTADVRVRFINFPEEARQHFLERPTYISTFDNS